MPRKKVTKQESVDPKWWQKLTYVLAYVILLAVLTILGVYGVSDNLKKPAIDLLTRGIDAYVGWLRAVQPPLRLLLLVLSASSLVLGVWRLAELVYRWFRGRESFSFPFIGQAFNLPLWPNRFYDEFYTKRQDIKQLRSRARETDRLQKRLDKVEEERDKLSNQLVMQLTAAESMMIDADQHTNAIKQLYRLMEHVNALLGSSGTAQYEEEFDTLVKEFAYALTGVTTDQRSDKFSSIMMVDQIRNVLYIIESVGLNRGSQGRTFKRGKGLRVGFGRRDRVTSSTTSTRIHVSSRMDSFRPDRMEV